jgi:hypothetical protein
MQLDFVEQQMTPEQLVYKWLCEGRINYEQATMAYVRKIEEDLRKANYEATSYTYPLFLMQEHAKLPAKKEWIRDKAIQMLYTFDNKRNGINFKKSFEEYVQEHKLNTNINTVQYQIYEEELNGGKYSKNTKQE